MVRVTRSYICGSDLHSYNGPVPDTHVESTFGQEITGIFEQIGSEVQKEGRGVEAQLERADHEDPRRR